MPGVVQFESAGYHFEGVAQKRRAVVLHATGRRFDSDHPYFASVVKLVGDT